MRTLAFVIMSAALVSATLAPARAQDVMGSTAVTGAGSTFAYPVMSRWARGYQRWASGGGDYATSGGGLDDPPAESRFDYEPVGSLAGTMRAKDRSVDFGASDVPLSSQELTRLGLGQFPVVMGGVLAVINPDGVGPGTLRLAGNVLADIFMGKIEKWNDPAIVALNPDLKLPDAKIALVHRSDGSGTTYNFAHYLAAVSPEWKARMGVDTLLSWPSGAGAKGNEGVAFAVARTKNSIGYVEYAQAMKAKLSFALIRNRAGKFVRPDAQSFASAATGANWSGAGDFNLMLTDAPGENAYPIAATVFVLMHKQQKAPQRTQAAINFFKWALEKGGKDAADLGYVPLPEPLVRQVKEYWQKSFGAGV
jgi:phosphate transport system substrate-binding protein